MMASAANNNASTLAPALQQQLETMLHFWQHLMPDPVHGGFWGAMNNDLQVIPQASKGCVLHARILWTFSSAAQQLANSSYTDCADDCYRFFQHFFDPEHGGVYWSLRYNGSPLDTKKQVYAQAFAIYGLAAYYQLRQQPAVLQQAVHLYQLLETHSLDKTAGGYFEAFSRQWGELPDLRLSEKDANEKKTMNTHLHVLEAYTALYRVWPHQQLLQSLLHLLQMFQTHILTNQYSMGLFFDEHWQRKDQQVSFGHNIEASWLLQEAAEATGDEAWITWSRELAVAMARQAIAGIDSDGGMWHEMNAATGHWQKEKHWWPQAEAMVGYYNAWQNSGDAALLQQSLRSWQFVQRYLLDSRTGEWFWGIDANYQRLPNEDFAGFWKCPYHNGRAYLELLKRMAANNE
ncbi:MAG: AGE family epimerase/isomerase [Chitinophagaceae bacterium]|nr:AGE family epimerase/isomerase [Chitinophagaceae bacterium]